MGLTQYNELGGLSNDLSYCFRFTDNQGTMFKFIQGDLSSVGYADETRFKKILENVWL